MSTKQAIGYFWVYYNTRKGKQPNYRTEDYERWKTSPWVIRQFDTEEHWKTPWPCVTPYNDLYVKAFEIIQCEVGLSVYQDDPPWKEEKSNSIRYVRGYLMLKGTISYR